MLSAAEIITTLDLKPHPEGGHYRETFRDENTVLGRSYLTAIYFLLRRGELSRWHRIDAVEIWHWYAGAPLRLSVKSDGNCSSDYVLGSDLEAGEAPQIVVPANAWQAAMSLGDYTLVGCTVTPGFEFARFELAPANFHSV